jgi:hypothetical protein
MQLYYADLFVNGRGATVIDGESKTQPPSVPVRIVGNATKKRQIASEQLLWLLSMTNKHASLGEIKI